MLHSNQSLKDKDKDFFFPYNKSLGVWNVWSLMFTLKLIMNFKVNALPQVSLHKLEKN